MTDAFISLNEWMRYHDINPEEFSVTIRTRNADEMMKFRKALNKDASTFLMDRTDRTIKSSNSGIICGIAFYTEFRP